MLIFPLLTNVCYKTNVPAKYEMIIINSIDRAIFLTAIWLPHGQLWTMINGAASLILLAYLTQRHWESCNEVGSLSSAVPLAGFELGTF